MTFLIAPVVFGFLMAETPPDYTREVEEYRAARQTAIAGEDGWITLAGLFWLKNGRNTVGSDDSNDMKLPASAPKHAGAILLHNKSARFVPAAGVEAPPLQFKPDDEKSAVWFGGVRLFAIKRENKLAIRVKDRDIEARKRFTGLVWYPIDPAWRIEAKYTPWPKPKTMAFNTVAGVREEMQNPGYLTFSKDGRELRLDPVIEDNVKFFIVMRDLTAGKTTYNAARFLYAAPPEGGFSHSGAVTLDFNVAVNPPCMFTPYATCPLPPQQNRMPIEVTAGEKIYGNGHDDTIRH